MMTGTSSQAVRLNLKGLLGPALVAGVAYIDPGNIATNLTAGSHFGYLLVWVLVVATVSAALFQYLSAKLGLATGLSLPAVLGQRFKSNQARVAFWLQAEAVAIATDVAEVLGGGIAVSLFTHLPMLLSAIVVAVISLIITAFKTRGHNRFNGIVIVLMLATTAGFVYLMGRSNLDWPTFLGGMVPRLSGTGSLLLATSIIGATIMPHAIYAHSALSRDAMGRDALSRDAMGRDANGGHLMSQLRAIRIDVGLAMTLAGLGNLAIMVFSAANLFRSKQDVGLLNAPALLNSAIGGGIGTVFILALFTSGVASSAVGNYAADEITGGLLRRRVSPVVRWLLALIPALGIIALAPNVTDAVVYSQVVLSFGLPFALFPLVKLTANSALMGAATNRRIVTLVGYAIAAGLSLLNLSLVSSLIFGG